MLEFLSQKPSRRRIIFLLSCLLLPIMLSCQFSMAPEGSAQIALEIELAASQSLKKAGTVATITRVVATVFTGVFETESYEELAVKELSISGRSANGTISVPKGEDRTFRVEAYDSKGIIQYHGNTKGLDIIENTFTVQIRLTPIPPDRPTLGYDAQTGIFNWTKSLDFDFAAYKMYRANSPGVTLSSDLLYTTGAVDSTFFVDHASLPSGSYYYRVFVVDTEGLISSGSNEVLRRIVN